MMMFFPRHNSEFVNNLGQMYPVEFEIKDTTESNTSASYLNLILRAVRLSNKHLGQGYVTERLKSYLRKFYGRYGDLTNQYEVPLSRMLHDILEETTYRDTLH